MLFRRPTVAEAQDPRKRQFVEFWNLVHSLEHTSDVRLGIWRAGQPKLTPAPVISSKPHAVFGWPGRAKLQWAQYPLDAIEDDPALLGTGKSNDVVFARRSLPKEIFEALEQQYSYRSTLDGQEEGWWFLDGKPPPKTQPSSRSTIALLPESKDSRSRGLHDGTDCLLLVDIDDWWGALSERALRVYETGAALDDHRPTQFAQWKRGHRMIYDVELAPSIPYNTVKRRFGQEAADRAVPDVKSIIVHCTRHRE
ncbi:MAG TPA: hypothetical protein VNO30_35900 [Kofleriaceae bacterium]|nr:hypothetical protein [Kofleriaceae bacterium]